MKSQKLASWLIRYCALIMLPTTILLAEEGHEDDDGPEFVSNEIVVKLSPTAVVTIAEINALFGTTTLSTVLESAGIFLVSIPDGVDLETLVDEMRDDGRLLYVEPNYITSVPQSGGHVIWAWSGGTPILGAFPEEIVGQAPTQLLDLPSVHSRSTGAGSIVAVLDTGVDFSHPNLADRLLDTGYDFVDDDPDPQDQRMNLDADGDGLFDENFGHGSHVAGTVLQSAPDASIVPIRVLDSEGQGSVFTLAEAIDHAISAGADIINLSLGMTFESALLDEAVERTLEADVLMVAAAGNGNSDLLVYPAANPTVLGVASVDQNDIKSTFTNWGWWIGVSAPGEAVISAYPENGYAAWSGTSMAAPLVAGQAALLKAAAPEIDSTDLGEIISSTAFDINALNPNWQEELGAGRIDVLASLQAVLPDEPDGLIVTDWIGFFWELEDEGWYYHPSIGYLFSLDDFGNDGWFFSLNRADWLYVARAWYPIIFSNAEGWHYLIGNPNGEIQHAYSYDRQEWILDFWRMGS